METPLKPDFHRSDGGRGPNRPHGLAGFTMIELMIVTVIVGLLVGLAVPRFDEVRQKAFNRTVLSDIRTTIAEIERFATIKYAFPNDENDLFAEGLTLSPGVSFTSFKVKDPNEPERAEVHIPAQT